MLVLLILKNRAGRANLKVVASAASTAGARGGAEYIAHTGTQHFASRSVTLSCVQSGETKIHSRKGDYGAIPGGLWTMRRSFVCSQKGHRSVPQMEGHAVAGFCWECPLELRVSAVRSEL